MKTIQIASIKILVLFFIFQFIGFSSTASHIAGGAITYKSLGSGRYYIETMVLRDCRGAQFNSWLATVDALCTSNSSAGWTSYTITHLPFVAPNPTKHGGPYAGISVNSGSKVLVAEEVSDVCDKLLDPSKFPNTSCRNRGSTAQSYIKFKFSAIITLSACNWWRLGFTPVCCRNTGSSNSRSGGMYIHTLINTKDYPNNSAPMFNDVSKPVHNAYVGQRLVFSLGAHDQDGDSLRFEPTCAMRDSTGCVRYNTGFTASRPVNGFKMDSLTGMVSCTPATAGKRIIGYWVKEYDRCSGKLKAKTLRDMQLRVEPSGNKTPFVKTQTHNLTGAAVLNSRGEIVVDEGQLITWDQTFADSNTTNSIYVTTNLDKVLPGATYSIIPTSRKNEIIVRTRWKAQIGISPRKTVTYFFNDDFCDYPGRGANAVSIVVGPSVGITGSSRGTSDSLTACIADTVQLVAIGGTKFSWRSISGNTLINGQNWFLDTNASDTNKSVKFVVTQSTKLEVTGLSLRKYCGKSVSYLQTVDTIDIIATDSFQLTTTNNVVCAPSNDTLLIQTSNSRLSYAYKWSPARDLLLNTTNSPVLKGLKKNKTFGVSVESNGGCVRTAETEVTTALPIPINNSILNVRSPLCAGDTIDLKLNLGQIAYDSCTTGEIQCGGNVKTAYTGAGSAKSDTTFETYPLIYASQNKSGKIQMIYRASELKQMGVQAGPLSSIAFEVHSLPNSAATFKEFTIKMGCTSGLHVASYLSSPNEVVYSSTNYRPVLGWNKHSFQNEYSWDGKSNLLVEICWVTQTPSANHPAITMDNLLYNSTRTYYQKTDTTACDNNTSGVSYFYRPRTEFGYCSRVNENNYQFTWSQIPSSSASGFISKTDSTNVAVVIGSNTARSYQVEIKDSSGVCSNTLVKTIQVVQKYDTKIDSIAPICNPRGPVQLRAATPPNVTTPGGKWTGPGIVDSRNGLWDRSKSGSGKFTVYYEITGNSCASKDSAKVTVLNLPNGAIQPIDFVCAKESDVSQHELVGVTPGGAFLGFGVESKIVGGKTVYYVNGKRFNPSLTNPDTVVIRHVVGNATCRNDTIIKLPVLPHWDTTYLGVYNQGVPFYTERFCSTGGSDTLAVRGKNPIWRMVDQQYASAILDSANGIFDPSKINNGKGGKVQIEVENNGFCGAKGRFFIDVIPAPEVRILATDFCFEVPGNCPGSGVPVQKENDTILVRVAKYPFVQIDDNNPATYVDVLQANASNTGWAGVLPMPFTQWDGSFWMSHKDRCAHRYCHLPPGRYPISYRLGFSYRTWDKDSVCYSVDDTALFMNNNFRLSLTKSGSLCNDGSVEMDASTNRPGTVFKWTGGSVGTKKIVSTPGVYKVVAEYKYCDSEDSFQVTSCVGVEELMSALDLKIYPNPARNIVHLKSNRVGPKTHLSIFTVTGQLIEGFEFDSYRNALEVAIDVSSFPKGVYLFHVDSEGVKGNYRVIIE